MANVHLSPCLDDVALGRGWYLLHMESMQGPHCVGVRVAAGGDVTIFDGHRAYMLSQSTFHAYCASCLDRKTLIFFQLVTGVDADLPPNRGQLDLLFVVAGAASSKGSNAVDEGENSDRDRDETRVHVLADLVRHVEQEVVEVKRDWQSTPPCQLAGKLSCLRCPLCPFYDFSRSARRNLKRDALRHMETFHTTPCDGSLPLGARLRGVVPSGNKQLKVLKALFDFDLLSNHPGVGYLRRSAESMSRHVAPALSGHLLVASGRRPRGSERGARWVTCFTPSISRRRAYTR